MDLAEQAKLTQLWQDILGLRDWRISVIPANVYDLGRNQRTETIVYEPSMKTAHLSILPADHPEVANMIQGHDIEETIVHALIHLHFAGLPELQNDAQHMLQEQMLNALAKAFIALKRGQLARQDQELERHVKTARRLAIDYGRGERQRCCIKDCDNPGVFAAPVRAESSFPPVALCREHRADLYGQE